ncbi:MAG: hypothetical protein BWY37_01967 [Firmicutes bacterium ADurb.Bin262]|nr:MAG: hypothetical protein BWY37_01967 [Firmicutes bacterium ADurb.Bin262]
MSFDCGRNLGVTRFSPSESVEKSYPAFFRDFNNLGGEADVI